MARRVAPAVLPAAWLAWAFLYLEAGTLVSVDKPLRFLTLLTVPAALLVAIALDGRLSPLLVPALAVASILVAAPRAEASARERNVVLLSQVADAMRDLPRAPVLSTDYVWWAKLGAFLPMGRLDVRRNVDPAYLDDAARARARRLDPLPDPAAYVGGYVVTGPERPTSGWPSNWPEAQALMRAAVKPADLVPVTRVGDVTVWRWTP